MPGVFISYSRRDTAFVRRLHDALSAREYDVWVDWEDIPPSAEWFEEIRTGVREADGFIYVISPDSVSSSVCTQELQNALDQNKRVVPVVCREPDGAVVPEGAAALNWVFLRDDDDFDSGLGLLVTALETDFDHVRDHTRLGVQAARWQASGHDRSQLLRGSELAAAEAWLVSGAGKPPEATQLQREYLLASRQSATQRQRTVIGAVSVALAVAVALAIVALVERSTAIHDRNVAVARQLDADAQANYPTDPELSVLLATRAAHVQPSAASESTLRIALAQSNVRARYTLAAHYGGDVAWSPDGRRLLVTSPGAWARIYTPGSSTPPVSLPGPSGRGASSWDADGNRVVIGGGRPGVYDATTGHLVGRIPDATIYAALSGDGSRVATVDVHSVGRVFDVASGRSVATFTPHLGGGATCFALSPNGRYVAQCDSLTLASVVGSSPARVDVWDTSNGRLVRSAPSPSLIASVAFSPDSARFVFATSPRQPGTGASLQALARAEGAPGTFVYDSTGSGPPVRTFPGAASAAVFGPSPRFSTVAYATLDGIAHVYQFYSGRSVPLSGAGDVSDVIRFDTGGGYVLTAGKDDTVRVYNADTGGQPIEVLAGHTGRVVDASFGAADHYIASSSDDGTARLWTGPAPIPSLQRPDAPLGDGATRSIAFTPDGRRVVQTGGGNALSGQGRILDARDLGTLGSFSAPAGQVFAGSQVARDGRVIALSVALANRRVVSQAVDTYDGRTGARLATIVPGGEPGIVDVVADGAGNEVATLGPGGRAEVWDTGTGRRLHALTGAETLIGAAAFSRDGGLLAVAHYPTLPKRVAYLTKFQPVFVEIWNLHTGRRQRTITGDTLKPQIPGEADYAPLAVTFSPDGRLLALSGADTSIEVFDTRTGVPAHPPLSIAGLSGGSYATVLDFSPDGRLLAAGSTAGAYLWSVPSFDQLPVFQHVAAGSASLIAGPQDVRVGITDDSRYLLTVGDSTLEAWSIRDHLQLFKAFPMAAGNLDAAGTKLVTSGGAGVSVYPCELCGGLSKLLALARRRVTRSFSPTERTQYLSQG